MKLTALVVDDEQLARDELAYLLERLEGVEVVGRCDNGIEALGRIEDLAPDIVFLDVQMPGVNGFEVARQLVQRNVPTEVVFVTAFDQFAVDAFQVNAVDYLLKPVDPARLEQAVQRAARRLSARAPGIGPAGLSNQDLARLVQLVTTRQARRERLAVHVGERVLLVDADDVVYASVAGDAVTIGAGTLTGVSNCRTLDELQALLDPAVFWRVHRSHLVNINKIKEIVPWFSRNYILRMKDAKQTEIPVSRSQTRRLREYLRL
jgi:DNA-binding LytR/AlgR family response regulator